MSEEVPQVVREQVSIAENAASETGPRTELGRALRDHLLKQAQLNPQRWARWQARMAGAGEFLQYSGLSNAGEAVLGEAWGQALKTIEPSTYLAKELAKKVSKSVLGKAYQQKVAALEKALDGHYSFADAFAQISEATWRDPVMPWRSVEDMQGWTASMPSEQTVLENLAKRPPYLRARPTAGSSMAKAESVAQEFAGALSKWSGAPRQRTIAETLVVYDDCLIPRGDAAPPTLRTAFLQKSPAPLTLEETKTSFSAARSFEGLRGFSRVGGIMIGRDARSKARDGFSDLRWTQEGTGIRLMLVRPNGSLARSRVFNPQLVRLALAYAADGRPIRGYDYECDATGAQAHPLAPGGRPDRAWQIPDRSRRLDLSQEGPESDERCTTTG
jgi:hypothetical protein